NEDVIEFIRPRIANGQKKLSEIVEELLDHCMADVIAKHIHPPTVFDFESRRDVADYEAEFSSRDARRYRSSSIPFHGQHRIDWLKCDQYRVDRELAVPLNGHSSEE
ncbi:hypothetical protein FOZ62_017184, partial [Perkinsus olseni]